MKRALIKYRAVDVDNRHMPLYLYTQPLDVIAEGEETAVVQAHNQEHYTYEFYKKDIEKVLG